MSPKKVDIHDSSQALYELGEAFWKLGELLGKVLREMRKAHEDAIKKTLKTDKTGFSTVYSFLKSYCAEGLLRRSSGGEERDIIECKEIELNRTSFGCIAKFLVKVPSRKVSISVVPDLCPAPTSDHCLRIDAVTVRDEHGNEIEGGHIAYIPLGVLENVTIRCKDRVTIALEPRAGRKKKWEVSDFSAEFDDVEEVQIVLKHMIGVYEKEIKEIVDYKRLKSKLVEKGVAITSVLEIVLT